MKKRNTEAANSKKNITFINMPISSSEEDKIGISQCASELKHVINQGAQSIAVTSNFGGGKSSLIRCLESDFCGLMTKFCYINLWGRAVGQDSENLHKSFIYQLASQISLRKGNYVSRRLSQNYGVLGLTLPSLWYAFLSFVMFLFLALGFACTTFYKTISQYITIDFYNTHHNKIGVASFAVAAFLGLLFIYKSDIVFSSKNSETKRKIDEHELMDIYKTNICKFHVKHYIVVIEDLDRSETQNVNRFIKELRRYYIPCKRKRSKHRIINWMNDKVLININRITFIVNIKSEHEIAQDGDMDLYSKAFDYVLNLKEINIDNYDVILEKLLEEKRKLFLDNNIPAFDSNGKFIPEFEWIIWGKKIGLRDIKSRLNAAISTYINLCSKFNQECISLQKCIAAAYIASAFEEEYYEIKDGGFDVIIDLYVTNPNMGQEDISKALEGSGKKIEISKQFAEDIKTLISNGLIASDYRQYFFNFPSDSYLHSNKQIKLINVILYDSDISADANFNELVSDVISSNESVIFSSFDRLKRLGKHFPNCIFYNKELFDLALKHDKDMLCKTLGEKLPYDSESIASTGRIIVDVIKRNLIASAKHVEMICEIVASKATPTALITFRKLLIENFFEEIIKFKSLFFGDCPLITKAEVDSLKGNVDMINLINLESSELTIELVHTIHVDILSGFDLFNDDTIERVSHFYKKLFLVLGSTENETLTHYMFEIMVKSQVINETMESIIIENNELNDIYERYVDTVCLAAHHGRISVNTLQYINDLGICKGLSELVCLKLQEHGYYKSFVINMSATNIDLIDFENEDIVSAINAIDFLDSKDKTVSMELLLLLRKQILFVCQEYAINQYRHLFFAPYPIINADELELVNNRVKSLNIIDAEQLDEKNCTYISKYLSRYLCGVNVSYELLCFVSSVKTNVKRDFFLALDFDMIQYYRMSNKRKSHIVENLSDAFDFNDLSDMMFYMLQTKSTYSSFEKHIKKVISNKEFKDHEKEYAEYIRQAKQINNEMLHNLCSLGTIYAMPGHVLEKLFLAKKFEYYVVSKTLADRRFVFEQHKLDLLSTSYEDIFLTEEGFYDTIKTRMAENSDFVFYMCNKALYVGTSKYTRRMFSNCRQTQASIQDLFDNYDDKFIIEYLSECEGFKDRDAAICFVTRIKDNEIVAASESVYNNNHHRLVDSNLKRLFTRYHHAAK